MTMGKEWCVLGDTLILKKCKKQNLVFKLSTKADYQCHVFPLFRDDIASGSIT